MKNILYITVNSEIGGGPKHILDLITNVDKEKYNIIIVAPNNGTYFELFNKQCECIAIDLKTNIVKNIFNVVKIAKVNNINICHSHGFGAGIYSRFLKLFIKDIKIVHTYHGIYYEKYNQIKKKIYINIEKVLGLMTDVSIAVSNKEKEEATKLGFQKENRIVTIYNGIEVSRIKKDAKYLTYNNAVSSGDYIIGCVARLDIDKGHMELINAFNMFCSKYSNSKLILVGDGIKRNSIEKQISDNKLDNKVIMLGYRSDVAKILSNLDMFVSSSYKEGLPYALIEAMLYEVPIVATDTTGNNEIVIDGFNGFLCKPRDAYSLFLTMEKMYLCENKKKLTKNGYDYVLDNFSLDKMINKIEGIYDKL